MPGDPETATRPPSDDISIERWIVLECLRLDEFATFWRNGAAGDNVDGLPVEAFPAAMPVEEWDEQYRSWGGG